MMVLGAILILSTLVVEFAYNSHVGYELASSERDRLKAYYLARSGYNLARLELKFEKDIRTRFAGLLKNLKGSGVTADPLCKQIPLSTGLLKGLSSGALPGMGGEEAAEGEEGSEAPVEEPSEKATGEAVAGAEEFLNFDGDFAVECDTEERKLSLSVFRADPLGTAGGATPPPTPAGGVGAPSAYDLQKELLFSLLSQKEFETALGDKADKPDEIRKIVNAIADWADKDDRINEAPGIGGGSEDADYSDLGYKVKNGKYTTVAELLLVFGVGDDLFEVLAPQVTVYGDNKINLCQAEDPMIRAFITRYVAATPGMPPISPTDDEKWNQVIEAIHFACGEPSPTKEAVAAAITPIIGATDNKALAAQITVANRFYRIESTGMAGESQAKIAAVIDAQQANPNLWKTLYFRVE